MPLHIKGGGERETDRDRERETEKDRDRYERESQAERADCEDRKKHRRLLVGISQCSYASRTVEYDAHESF